MFLEFFLKSSSLFVPGFWTPPLLEAPDKEEQLEFGLNSLFILLPDSSSTVIQGGDGAGLGSG